MTTRAIAPAAVLSAGLAFALALALAGCPGGPGANNPRVASEAGLSLTYYVDRKAAPDGAIARIVVVEQRRWIDVGADQELDIDQIDEGADLESLVIESLSGSGSGGLVIGACARDSVVSAMKSSSTAWIGRRAEITVESGGTAAGTIRAIHDSTVVLADDAGKTTAVTLTNWRALRLIGGDSRVRCQVTAGSGRQLVRVVYTTPALGFGSEHLMVAKLGPDGKGEVALTPRFTVDTPAWQVVADVALYDGMPGGSRTPTEVFRGPITLTGDPVIVAGVVRTAPARLEAIYRGAMASPGDDAREQVREQYWRNGSNLDVWDWLELDLGDDTMPPGRVMLEVAQAGDPVPQPVIVEADAIEVAEIADDQPGGRVRIKLWPAVDLRGRRDKQFMNQPTNGLVESLHFAISNSGDRPREVLIEEELRPAKKRSVLRPWPRKPTLRDNVLRVRVTAPPGIAAHAGYVLDYEW